MKVDAYRCDCCKNIYEVDEITGFDSTTDLFDTYNSFKVVNNPAKVTAHFCLECYRQKVLVQAENSMPRKFNLEDHEAKRKELAYLFKLSIINELRRSKKI